MKCASENGVTAIRNYQVRNKTLIDAGKTYAFLNVIRKTGDESFWTTKNTNIVEWISLDVPEHVMTQSVTTTPVNSPRKLSQALNCSSTGVVKGKIVQVLFICFHLFSYKVCLSSTTTSLVLHCIYM